MSVRTDISETVRPRMMKLYMRNLHLIWKISTEKNFGKFEKKKFPGFFQFLLSTPKAEPEGDRREPKGEYVSKLFYDSRCKIYKVADEAQGTHSNTVLIARIVFVALETITLFCIALLHSSLLSFFKLSPGRRDEEISECHDCYWIYAVHIGWNGPTFVSQHF